MNAAYSVFADGLSQTPVFASPLDRGRTLLDPNSLDILRKLQGGNMQIFLSQSASEALRKKRKLPTTMVGS